MPAESHRIFILVAAGACVFIASVAVFVKVLPPHRDLDYLLAGAVATIVTLAVVFVAVNLTVFRSSNPFWKSRHHPKDDE